MKCCTIPPTTNPIPLPASTFPPTHHISPPPLLPLPPPVIFCSSYSFSLYPSLLLISPHLLAHPPSPSPRPRIQTPPPLHTFVLPLSFPRLRTSPPPSFSHHLHPCRDTHAHTHATNTGGSSNTFLRCAHDADALSHRLVYAAVREVLERFRIMPRVEPVCGQRGGGVGERGVGEVEGRKERAGVGGRGGQQRERETRTKAQRENGRMRQVIEHLVVSHYCRGH